MHSSCFPVRSSNKFILTTGHSHSILLYNGGQPLIIIITYYQFSAITVHGTLQIIQYDSPLLHGVYSLHKGNETTKRGEWETGQGQMGKLFCQIRRGSHLCQMQTANDLLEKVHLKIGFEGRERGGKGKAVPSLGGSYG